MFTSPFANTSQKTKKKLTFSLFYLLIVSMVTMRYFDTYLINKITPNGIISFEFSKTLERSQEILDSWSPLAKIFAGLSLGYDFFFLLIYALFISLLIHKLNERLWIGKPFYRTGEILIWTMFIVVIFEAVENVCLIKLLTGSSYQYWASVAYYFAAAKFLLISISVLYIISNFFIVLFKKRS
jgi:hypothetical protein